MRTYDCLVFLIGNFRISEGFKMALPISWSFFKRSLCQTSNVSSVDLWVRWNRVPQGIKQAGFRGDETVCAESVLKRLLFVVSVDH